jgi:hypothetical protein
MTLTLTKVGLIRIRNFSTTTADDVKKVTRTLALALALALALTLTSRR